MMDVKFQICIVATLSSILIAGCVPKESALKNADFSKLAPFIYKETGYTVSYDPCALSWAYPEKANASVKQKCDTEAFQLAVKLSEGGFGEISSDDIYFPKFWKFYEAYVKEQRAKKKPFEMPKW